MTVLKKCEKLKATGPAVYLEPESFQGTGMKA